ncbi:MAG TPA: hypothetical protein VGX69_00135 [Solirubrobacteraceae bacterium]|jgi:hypothetical protein|nr:hypothetical protein [Solirubrobacteraceae bacterium]
MTSPVRNLIAVAALAATLVLSISGVAAARAGDRSFQQTFPIASPLCARVAANTEGKRLKRFAPRVSADCGALQSTFTAAQTAVLAVRQAVTPQLTADRAAVAAACPPGRQSPACRQAHRVNDHAIDVMAHRLQVAARQYYRTIELARERFWNAIHALPPGRHLRADAPIPDLSS